MRYKPFGFGDGEVGIDGSDSESAAEQLPSKKKQKKTDVQFPRILGQHDTITEGKPPENNIGSSAKAKKDKRKRKERESETPVPKKPTAPNEPAWSFAGVDAQGEPTKQEAAGADATEDTTMVNGDDTVMTNGANSKEEKAQRKEERRLARERKEARRKARESVAASS